MPATIIYPGDNVYQAIESLRLPNRMSDPVLSEYFSIETEDTDIMKWSVDDIIGGMMAARGIDGPPSRVQRVGSKTYIAQPGHYGDFDILTEDEIEKKRNWNGGFIDVTEQVAKIDEQLEHRMATRIRHTATNLVVNGSFDVLTPSGARVHSDKYNQTKYKSAVAWSTVATATPIADFRAVKLLARGTNNSFGRDAKAIMNQTTFNRLSSNTNASDLGGKRTQGLASITGVKEINTVLLDDDLPQIFINDDTYPNETGEGWSLFIPDNIVVVIGARPGGKRIGRFVFTRNAYNPGGSPGVYTFTVRNLPGKGSGIIEHHKGFNGGIELNYPSAIVAMDVS